MPTAPTRWSLVLRAAQIDDDGRRALDELCTAYWPPVWALFRRSGLDVEEARDATQGFFADFLARGEFGNADPARGRFRAFLSTCARHWLSRQREHERALVRGGGVRPLSLDVDGEEERLRREPVDRLDPAALFDRRWAQAVVERALLRLADDERRAGRAAWFPHLRPALDGVPLPRPWAEVARELGTSEGALKVAAHRLRGRLREALLAEVGHTVHDPAAAEDELQRLLQALGT